jgi:hypothetical protein
MTVAAMSWMKDRVKHGARSEDEDDDLDDDVETACMTSRGWRSRSSSRASVDSWESQSEDDFEVSSPSELSPSRGDQVTEGGSADAGPVLISLDKRRGPIGVVVSSSSGVPKVSKIIGGLVEEWNDRHPRCKVSAGDTILEVNGVSGDPIMMLRELARGPDSVRLLVLGQVQPGGAA